MYNDRTVVRAKPLDQMNSLRDMGHFPPLVNAGATVNVLITIAVTFVVFGRFAGSAVALPAWVAVVLVVNLMPVILLRAIGWRAGAPMPVVEQMEFVGDQHRFADWVYLAASANMAFWIALSWCGFALTPGVGTLAAVLVLALVCTFAPVWLRLFRRADG
jgi:hypothetical protein